MPVAGRARDLPETALRATSFRPTTPPSRAPLTWVVVRGRGVTHGVVNHPRIDGEDGVTGSIPGGGLHTKADQRKGWPASFPSRLGPARSSRDVAEGQNSSRSVIGPLSSTFATR